MMKVIGEEGTPLSDFVLYLKSELIDAVYLQQNTFDPVDGATSAERQRYCFGKVVSILETEFDFEDKAAARTSFLQLRQTIIDWNYTKWDSDEFRHGETRIDEEIAAAGRIA